MKSKMAIKGTMAVILAALITVGASGAWADCSDATVQQNRTNYQKEVANNNLKVTQGSPSIPVNNQCHQATQNNMLSMVSLSDPASLAASAVKGLISKLPVPSLPGGLSLGSLGLGSGAAGAGGGLLTSTSSMIKSAVPSGQCTQ